MSVLELIHSAGSHLRPWEKENFGKWGLEKLIEARQHTDIIRRWR